MARHKNQSDFHHEDSFEDIQIPAPEITPEKKTISVLPEGIFNIESAPKDGTNIIVMKDHDDGGVMAYWRNTRVRWMGQWRPQGGWRDPLTHMIVTFIPKYWKDADSVEWKIDNSIIDKARIAELEKKVAELLRGR